MGKVGMRALCADLQTLKRTGHGKPKKARQAGSAPGGKKSVEGAAVQRRAVVVSKVREEEWMEELEELAQVVYAPFEKAEVTVRPLRDGKGRFRHLVKVVREVDGGDGAAERAFLEALSATDALSAEQYPSLSGAKMGVKLVGGVDTPPPQPQDAAPKTPPGTPPSPARPAKRPAAAVDDVEVEVEADVPPAAARTRSIVLVGNVRNEEAIAGLRRALVGEGMTSNEEGKPVGEEGVLELPAGGDDASAGVLKVFARAAPAPRKKRKRDAATDPAAALTVEATLGELAWGVAAAPLFNSKTNAFRKMVKLTLEARSDAADTAAAAGGAGALGRVLAAEALMRHLAAAFPSYRVVVKDEEVAAGVGAPAEASGKPAVAAPVKYFVGNLPKGEHGGEEAIRDAFMKACGAKISSLKVLKNEHGIPNGCAVVAFAKVKQAAAAEAAVAKEKVLVGARAVRMEQQKSKEELSERGLIGDKHVVFAANLPLTLTQDQIRFALRKFGEVDKVTMNRGDDGEFNGTARVTYASAVSVANAVQHSMNLLINRRPIRLDLDKRKAARTAQLDLNQSQSHSKTVVVQPTNPAMALHPAAVKAIMGSIGKLKFCRRTTQDERPADMDEAAVAGAVTAGFTTSACVGLATQLVGREVACVPRDLGAGADMNEKDMPKCSIIVKVLEDAEAAVTATKPKEPIQFTFNGARYWNNKEWAKQKRIESLEGWNRKGWEW
eukprot:TRINITY_DN6053_c0_g1_i1.p1 TRINITY_DN6053_c0_g1~~TRINITY_DN6053_c0_g1_i1.p1  ORF type:complete len:723 (+),score=293.32 TRINITY_DN6053_c0_g1_i1:76-2244(+)